MATIRWTKPSGGLWATPSDWTGGKVPGPPDDVIVAGSGTGTITFNNRVMVRTLLLDAPNGTIAGHATFRLGVEMVIQAGLFRLDHGATIAGGLILDPASGLRSAGGTLSGVHYQGTLDLGQPGAFLTIQHGITLAAPGGAGPATILLTGAGSELAVAGTTRLDNAKLDISVGPPGATTSGLCLLDPARGGGTLTLGAGVVVDQTGAFAALHAGTTLGDTILNQGRITAAHDGGTLTLDGAAFTNAGTLTVGNGNILAVGNTTFINTGDLIAAPGGAGQAATRLTFQGPIANTGIILAGAGTTTFAEDVAGTGQLQIGAAGTLDLLAGAAAGETVNFLATSGALAIANPSVFLGTISHWGAADRIDLAYVTSNGSSFANGTLSVLESGQTVATLHFAGTYTQADFMLATDNVGGTAITFI